MVAPGNMEAANAFLSRFKPFLTVTGEEEAKLLYRAKAGDRRAMDRLCKAHIRFIAKVAGFYRCQHLEFEDLVISGMMGLCKAAQRFDPAKGVKFITYAAWWIHQAITASIASQDNLVRLPHKFRIESKRAAKMLQAGHIISRQQKRVLEAWSGRGSVSLDTDEGWTPNALVDSKNPHQSYEDSEAVSVYLDALPAKTKEVLECRYGIGRTGVPSKYIDIGERFGCSKQWANQMVTRGVAAVRKRARHIQMADL